LQNCPSALIATSLAAPLDITAVPVCDSYSGIPELSRRFVQRGSESFEQSAPE